MALGRFSLEFFGFPCQSSFHQMLIRRCYNRPIGVRRTKWTQSHPTPRKKKKEKEIHLITTLCEDESKKQTGTDLNVIPTLNSLTDYSVWTPTSLAWFWFVIQLVTIFCYTTLHSKPYIRPQGQKRMRYYTGWSRGSTSKHQERVSDMLWTIFARWKYLRNP
jgi:hypothetical protein